MFFYIIKKKKGITCVALATHRLIVHPPRLMKGMSTLKGSDFEPFFLNRRGIFGFPWGAKGQKMIILR